MLIHVVYYQAQTTSDGLQIREPISSPDTRLLVLPSFRRTAATRRVSRSRSLEMYQVTPTEMKASAWKTMHTIKGTVYLGAYWERNTWGPVCCRSD